MSKVQQVAVMYQIVSTLTMDDLAPKYNVCLYLALLTFTTIYLYLA